ncbi:hypothetical protein RchiOBHm_Chr1g0325071 [Rosa chinensis]|uniref:Uncharacterized protein n=1 Tax=Rosa chinensis TaxID=74649 RepID=A0A2P6S9Z7_ROSCH|nr:hypothetical protein RchiOBHm_Chr1g0325071 [Rosa chinensis]
MTSEDGSAERGFRSAETCHGWGFTCQVVTSLGSQRMMTVDTWLTLRGLASGGLPPKPSRLLVINASNDGFRNRGDASANPGS